MFYTSVKSNRCKASKDVEGNVVNKTDILSAPEWVEVFQKLGYPLYMLPAIGVAKLLGIIALLIPGFPRIKEWAYAGFFFDLTGAVYSGLE